MLKEINSWYKVSKRPSGFGYDVYCFYCHKKSVAWDYRRNAIGVGIFHVVKNHMASLYHHAEWIDDVTEVEDE